MLELDRSKNDTSGVLNLLRAVAAQVVCIGHAGRFFLQDFSFHPMPQDIGVQIFFVLSGFLISFVLVERSANPYYGFGTFVIDRFARIYSALIPCLVFVIAVDGISLHWTGAAYLYRYDDWRTLIANLFMMEDYRGAFDNYDALQWSAFGSAAPLWTLAIEWHIYIFVGALFFIRKSTWSAPLLIPVAIVFGQMPSHYLFGAVQDDGVGNSLFLLWLGGAYIMLILRNWRLPLLPCAILLLVSTALYFQHAGSVEYQVGSFPWLILAIFALIAASQQTKILRFDGLNRYISFAADYSFTLYLTHHTIMVSMFAFGAHGPLAFLCAITASNMVAAVLAVYTEMKHKAFARLIKSALRWPRGSQSSVVEQTAASPPV